jgi:putative glutamine amidotransferase
MPRADPVHHVKLHEGSVLADIFGKHEVAVNSHHHQGLDRIADGLEEIGFAGDGVLEAAVVPRYSGVLGVQWHPEVMAPLDHLQMALFERFVAATRLYSEQESAA